MPDVAWEHCRYATVIHALLNGTASIEQNWGVLHACSAIQPFNESAPMPDLPAQQHRRAYYAAVTHTDRLIGGTLGKLASLGMSDSTAVVVIGDHGYELGEHNMWVSTCLLVLLAD